MDKLKRKKIVFHTLGCKLNFAETSTIARSFPEERFEKVSAKQKADIYIINTCSVTDAADKKCRQAIRKFMNRSPGAFIAVVGCYSQLRPEQVSGIPGVDLVLGINERFNIHDFAGDFEKRDSCRTYSASLSSAVNFISSYSYGDRTRSFLKIQDGCDYGCAYCTIPLARGISRSPDIGTLVREATLIAEKGVREIILTGVNIGDFGRKSGESLEGLLKELVKVPGIERYRISSVEPNLLTDELIEMSLTDPKILPHFHIPLQSASDKILALMGRRYRRELFSNKAERIRNSIPFAGIGTDIITGFPGETDKDFEDAYGFLYDLPLSYIHVFPYSERPGTRAATLPGKVPHQLKEMRSKRLLALAEKKHKEFLEINNGQTEKVLFESTKTSGAITGFTGNYIRVEYPWDPSLAGQIRKIRIQGIAPSGRLNIYILEE